MGHSRDRPESSFEVNSKCLLAAGGPNRVKKMEVATMERKNLVESAVSFFGSDYWKKTLTILQDPKAMHVHLFVETQIHPWSLQTVVESVMAAAGWNILRKTARFEVRGYGCLMFHPSGIASFDIFCKYSPDAMLRVGKPTPPLTDKTWWKSEVQEFINRYKYREIALGDVAGIQSYFWSKQWLRIYELLRDPKIQHFHCKIETSIHPESLAKFAAESLQSKGWKVNQCQQGFAREAGEVRFTTSYGSYLAPAFDLLWAFNPDIALKPNAGAVGGMFPEDLEFDIFTIDSIYRLIEKDGYQELKKAEIEEIVNAIVP
jgi:hypothetical protein